MRAGSGQAGGTSDTRIFRQGEAIVGKLLARYPPIARRSGREPLGAGAGASIGPGHLRPRARGEGSGFFSRATLAVPEGPGWEKVLGAGLGEDERGTSPGIPPRA